MAAVVQTALYPASQREKSTDKAEIIHEQPMDPSDMAGQDHNPRKIAQLAYSYWEERGCPYGSAEEDWFRAERELYGDSSVTEI
jgi:Protein of unknown function (DUF2934)